VTRTVEAPESEGPEPDDGPAPRRDRVAAALTRRLGGFVVVCEGVRRRHNVSAILRTCEAFGVHEVHLVGEGSARASHGTARGAERWVLRRRFRTVGESLADLRGRGFRVYTADLVPGAHTPESAPVDAPFALVFGSEWAGVSPEAKAACDGAVCIPMEGLTGSLNVSASAAILVRTLAMRRRAHAGADLDPAEQGRFLAEWEAFEQAAATGLAARTAPVGEGDLGGGMRFEER
jgi:tRNA (guanosine-2'-O-)-methyltransferase